MEGSDRFPDVWRRFIADGSVLEASWLRSARAGVDRDRARLRRVDDAELARRLAANASLVRFATPHLEWLSAALSPQPHVAFVVDRDGIVLASVGSDPEAMERDGGVPGFDWSERQMGTNGAGTALVAGEPVAVIGGEHFCHAYDRLSCVAAPIRDPGGAIVGAIDLSTPTGESDRQRLITVAHVAHVIELHLAQEADAAEAARGVERTRRLEAMMTALARARTDGEVADVVVHESFATIGAATAAVHVVEDDSAMLATVATRGFDAGLARPRLGVDEPLPVAEAVRRREGIWIGSRDELVARYPTVRGSRVAAERVQALVSLPLLVDDRCVGCISFTFATSRPFDDDERRFILTAAAACAQAMDRARAQRREAEALTGRLRRVETWLRRIYDSPLVGIAIANGREVLEANDAFVALVGYDRSDVEARRLTWRLLSAPESLARDERARQELRAHGFCAPYEKEYVHKDGHRVPVLIGAARLDGDELALVVLDNRARHDAEQFQRHIIGVVSHDLRNPVAAIELSAEAQRTHPGADAMVQKLAANIIAACRGMHRIIGDLLDYARTRHTDGIPIQPQLWVLADVVDEVLARCRQAFPGCDIAAHGDRDLTGEWDPARLAQLLTNLVANAIEHGAPGRPVTLTWRAADDGVRIDVHNEGEPIAEAELPSLFEPFRRGQGGGVGVGLGLFIVREIARAHGGQVEVRSTRQDGTTFTVTLPR